jgi:hypothetical protein
MTRLVISGSALPPDISQTDQSAGMGQFRTHALQQKEAYSVNSSARAICVGGTVRPSAFAILGFRQQRADLGLARKRHSPLHYLWILKGTGRLHQMQDPYAEAVNIGVNFREATDRVADSPAFVKIRRPQASRAWKREVARLHD